MINLVATSRRKSYCAAILVCVVAALPMLIAGAYVLFSISPPEGPRWYRVASVSEVRKHSRPLLAMVITRQRDAWMTTNADLRAFYVVSQDDTFVVLHGYHHPQFRISVSYSGARAAFLSSCYDMEFGLDGKQLNAEDRSQDMPQIPSRIRSGELYVQL